MNTTISAGIQKQIDEYNNICRYLETDMPDLGNRKITLKLIFTVKQEQKDETYFDNDQ